MLRIVGGLLALVLIAYLVALGAQRWQARRAIKMYDQMCALRMGDTPADIARKAPSLGHIDANGEYHWRVYSSAALWTGRIVDILIEDPNHVVATEHFWQAFGLRRWDSDFGITVRNGQLQQASALVFVAGYTHMVGVRWRLTPELDATDPAPRSAQATFGVANITYGFHHNVIWGGRCRHISLSSHSSEQTLSMRRMDGRCLTSRKACDAMKELLPALPQNAAEGGWIE